MSQRVFIKAAVVIPAGRHYDKSLIDLAAEALLRAWDKTGNEPLDYVVFASAFSELSEEQTLASSYLCEFLSLDKTPSLRVELGDASGLAALDLAYKLIRGGYAKTVAVVGVEKLSDFTSVILNKVLSTLCNSRFESYYGVTPAVHAALMTKYYMSKYGYSYEDIVVWSVRMHERGSENPYAYMRRKLSKTDILQSEIVSDPIRLFDIAPPADGAACIILGSEPSKDFRIEVLHTVQTSCNTALTLREDMARLYTLEAGRELVEKYSPTLLELPDKFSIVGILGVEALGLAQPGTAPRLLEEGRFGPDDKICVNLSGGLKCLGYTGGASGLYLAAMLTLELLGERPFDKIAGKHEVGLVADMAEIDRASVLAVLKRLA